MNYIQTGEGLAHTLKAECYLQEKLQGRTCFHLEFERTGNIKPEKKLMFFFKTKNFLNRLFKKCIEQRIEPMYMFLLKEWYLFIY